MGSGVAQLVERSLLTPEVHGSNPVNRHRKDENEEKRGWEFFRAKYEGKYYCTAGIQFAWLGFNSVTKHK